MRGDIVFRVYGCHAGRERDVYFGTFRTDAEAQAKLAELSARQPWAAEHHDKGFEIRRAAIETAFEIPSLPKPRDAYAVKTTPRPNARGWDSTIVEVFRRTDAGLEKRGEYIRNYRMLHTFEPFRQSGRDYALVSRDYTRTAVLDLATGEVIAEEPDPRGGFCPVGFYVPDWWDVHDGHVIPGSEHWREDHEWPVGDAGFVWGCHWGDDTSWKIQHLDLRGIRDGVIRRDDRFGYVPIATHSWDPPWTDLERPTATRSAPPKFIDLYRHEGAVGVRLHVVQTYDLDSGALRTDE